MSDDQNIYWLEMRLDNDVRTRLWKVEEWCKETRKCLLEIEEVRQISDDPGETYLVIRTWKGRFGDARTEYEVGPMYEVGDSNVNKEKVFIQN